MGYAISANGTDWETRYDLPDVGEGWAGLATGHVITRSVRDSAAFLDATHGPSPGDPYCAPAIARPFLDEVGAEPGRLRIAFSYDGNSGQAAHPDCRAAVDHAVALLTELGHELVTLFLHSIGINKTHLSRKATISG